MTPNLNVVVSRLGDLWIMNEHGLGVGDALIADTYAPLMAGELAQAAVVDLPYNRPTRDFSTTGRFDDFK